MLIGEGLNGPVLVIWKNLMRGHRTASLTASGKVRMFICRKEISSRLPKLAFARLTHLHASGTSHVQLVPRDADDLALEASGIVLVGFISQVREEVEILRVLRSFFLDVLVSGLGAVQRRPPRQLSPQVLSKEKTAGVSDLATINTKKRLPELASCATTSSEALTANSCSALRTLTPSPARP